MVTNPLMQPPFRGSRFWGRMTHWGSLGFREDCVSMSELYGIFISAQDHSLSLITFNTFVQSSTEPSSSAPSSPSPSLLLCMLQVPADAPVSAWLAGGPPGCAAARRHAPLVCCAHPHAETTCLASLRSSSDSLFLSTSANSRDLQAARSSPVAGFEECSDWGLLGGHLLRKLILAKPNTVIFCYALFCTPGRQTESN